LAAAFPLTLAMDEIRIFLMAFYGHCSNCAWPALFRGGGGRGGECIELDIKISKSRSNLEYVVFGVGFKAAKHIVMLCRFCGLTP